MSVYFAVSVAPEDGPRMTLHGTVPFMLLEGGTSERSTPSTVVGRPAAAKVGHIETLYGDIFLSHILVLLHGLPAPVCNTLNTKVGPR